MSSPEGLAPEICRNCKFFWKNITGRYLLNECNTFDTDDNAPCELNPSQFLSYAPERSLGEGISAKDLEEKEE